MSGSPPSIYPMVEGHGDLNAVQRLIARLRPDWIVRKSWRVKRGAFVHRSSDHRLETRVPILARQIRESNAIGGILIILDADDDCPAHLGPALLERAQLICADIPIQVVLAKRMFESWLLAGNAVPNACTEPEAIANPKTVLKSALGHYAEAADQGGLTSGLDIQAARRRSDSFDKFCRTLEWFDNYFQSKRSASRG